MGETVSNNSSIECYSVPTEGVWQVLRWIHYDLSEVDFAALRADIEPRLAANTEFKPLELVSAGVRIAAAYFLPLYGNVATLGGLRARRECEMQAGFVMQEFQRLLNEAGIAQIQALIDVDNVASRLVMLNSPFYQVTTVRHLWFNLLNVAKLAEVSIAGYSCVPACSFTKNEIDSLVEETFVGTLDCPDLDGVRSPSEVVNGFLESKAWDLSLPWWVLCDGHRPIGCALVNGHPRGIYELAYVGLTPASRGRGLGRELVNFTIHRCRSLGGSYFTTAVDTKNWPACMIYDSLGFSQIRELAVWLPKVSKSRQTVAA